MKQVKIIGAGSVGTHHAHACRQLGWQVTVVDTDPAALERMRTQLFPARYGSWDSEIGLATPSDADSSRADLIIIGTPPDSHVPLAVQALAERPRAVLIEKPLAPPYADISELVNRAQLDGIRVFIGYDHVVGKAANMVREELRRGTVGEVLTIDVEFREHWAGIFQAHPWLSGPKDSYLGFWQRGGGASGEHSHAINLWQHFAQVCGAGRVSIVNAALDYVQNGTVTYDQLCLLTLKTESGMLGRVVQDVVTIPSRKWAKIQGTAGAIEWHVGFQPGADAVILRRSGCEDDVQLVPKIRPDDFIDQLRHIETCRELGAPSPIDLVHGVDTLTVITAAHESQRTQRPIETRLA